MWQEALSPRELNLMTDNQVWNQLVGKSKTCFIRARTYWLYKEILKPIALQLEESVSLTDGSCHVHAMTTPTIPVTQEAEAGGSRD